MSAAPVSFFVRGTLISGWLGGIAPLVPRAEIRAARFDAATAIPSLEHLPLGFGVAAVFAIFIIVLFGFIYWKTDDYLTHDPIA